MDILADHGRLARLNRTQRAIWRQRNRELIDLVLDDPTGHLTSSYSKRTWPPYATDSGSVGATTATCRGSTH
jgi:hypothetical protein